MKVKEIMMQNDNNLSWCKPLSFDNGAVAITVNEGDITSIKIDGVDAEVSPATINAVARRVNEDYNEYIGWDDKHILLDADPLELPCRLCPWFNDCDVMSDDCDD